MNGPVVMYRMKPLTVFDDYIEVPQCMYKMKPIQESYFDHHSDNVSNCVKTTNVTEQVKKLLKCPLPEIAALENRQEAILKQLAQLKKQMTALREELKKSESISEKLNMPSINSQLVYHPDIVINASPEFPPYSLLALTHFWKGKVNICFKCYTHSTLHLPNAVNFQTEGKSKIEGTPIINVKLIWKPVGAESEMIVSPLKHVPICGESNILRYFSRLGPSEFNYELSEDPTVPTKIDSFLDVCYQLARTRTIKEKQTLIKYVNSQLGKSAFLTGSSCSLADIAVWSVLLQRNLTTNSDLTVNMLKWFKKCCELFDVCK